MCPHSTLFFRPDPGPLPLGPGFGLFWGCWGYPEPVTVAVFLLSLGATARITHFVNTDQLFAPVRAFATRHSRYPGDADKGVAYLLRCPWCASVWIAAGVFAVAEFWGDTAGFRIVAGALTASYLYAGLIRPLLADADD